MLRLLLAISFFLGSLLVVFKAPTNLLWKATVAVVEFPHLSMLASLILLISCYWATRYKLPTIVFTSLSLLIFSATIFRAYHRAADLDNELAKAFPNTNHRSLENPLLSAFSFATLFTGVKNKTADYKTMVYKSMNNESFTLDYYPTSSTAASPCVIVIHGGSRREGDSQQLPLINRYLANRGYNVASINYRLAPAYKNPAPVEDTKDAIDYIIKNSVALKVDTSNFILLGRSAGGQIALLAAYTLHHKNIKGVIAIYAPADMVWGARIKGNKWVLDTDKVLGDYIGGSVEEELEKYKLSSPFEFVDNTSTPTLLIHGEHDCMVGFQHSVHLQKKLTDCNVKNYLLDIPWGTHGCDYNISGPSGQVTTYAIERFINDVVSK